MKKVIIITGASSGFGKLTAKKLIDSGDWIVYAAARRMNEMQDLEALGANILQMDVSKQEDIDEGVRQILREQGRIDTLLAGAGYGEYGMIEDVPMDKVIYQYDVNVFGLTRLVKAVLPGMRERKSGRIVLMGSLVSNFSTLGLGYYASTKHAVKALGVSLRQEVKQFGIEVVMIEAGVVDTGFGAVAMNQLRRVEHGEAYQDLVGVFDAYMDYSYANCPKPAKTVNKIFKAITASHPRTVYKTTADAWLFPVLQFIFPARLIDKITIMTMKKVSKRKA